MNKLFKIFVAASFISIHANALSLQTVFDTYYGNTSRYAFAGDKRGFAYCGGIEIHYHHQVKYDADGNGAE